MNKVFLLGRLGKDPETRHSAGGNQVTKFSMATSETYFNKRTNEREEKTEWHNCVCFGKTAEVVDKYLSKGRQTLVEGAIQTRKWEDTTGTTKYTTEIIVRNLTLLGGGDTQRTNQQPTQQKKQQTAKEQDFDDDIPF